MTMSDPIADMLTRIRNANTAKHDTVDVPASKMKLAIAQILLDEGYIKKYDVLDEGSFKTIHITLKYGEDKNEKIISGIKRISKPGLRVYAGKEELPRVLGGPIIPRGKALGAAWYLPEERHNNITTTTSSRYLSIACIFMIASHYNTSLH